MSGKRKKSGTPPSDFKRIKAKVGKKALKPANVTDTSFRAASVSVRNQTVDASAAAASDKLVSARGRSVHELTTQLHHPAAAVRTSAIRGLGSVVATNSEFLKAHLSTLLPAVAKCCVDEEDSVRQLGLTVLRDILTRTADESVLRPFLPLLTAYVTSALNSLDRSTRLDGSRAVEILSTALPSPMDSQVELLLPAYCALLSDHSHHSRRNGDATSKKRKKTGKVSEIGRYTILQSLVCLLRTIPEKQVIAWDASGTVDDAKPDLTFVPGGRTVNALLLVGQHGRSVSPIQSINELMGFIEAHQASTKIGRSLGNGGLSVLIASDLISKLRNILVEITQRGNNDGSRGGLFLGAADIEELSLLVASIQLFWNAFCHDMIRESSDAKEVAGLRQVFTTLLSLMMESFPVQQQNPSKDLAVKYDLLNADVCATLMDIGGYLATESKGVDWTTSVLDYLLPRLKHDYMVPTKEDVHDSQVLSVPSSTVVDVIARLLLLKHVASEFALAQKTRCMVMEKVCEAFFSDRDLNVDVMRSAAGRRAALLIMAVLSHEGFILDDGQNPYATSLQMATKILPYYLQAWGGDYLTESSAVLSALHDVARRLDTECSSDQDTVKSLRDGLGVVFATPTRPKGKKRPRTFDSPIFELYTEEMQRLALGILVMLRLPSYETINGLGYMCARCSCGDVTSAISPAIADAVLYAVHSIRRSMSMQAYLMFVIRSIGIVNASSKRKHTGDRQGDGSPNLSHDAGEKGDIVASLDTKNPAEPVEDNSSLKQETRLSESQVDLKLVKASEAPVVRATRCLILCGSEKVLPMIAPVLKEWLAGIRKDSGLEPAAKMILFRAASAVIAMLSLDIQSSSSYMAGECISPPSIVDLAPELARNVVTAVCDAFLLCSSRSRNEKDSHGLFDYLLQPTLAMMHNDVKFVEASFAEASNRICDQITDQTEVSSYIEALLAIVRNPELAHVLRKASSSLTKCCGSVESALANGSLDRQAGSLGAAVNLLIGNSQE